MDGNVLAERKQTHSMSRRDGENPVVAFNPLELAALLNGLFRGGIDATSGLVEVESGFTHNATPMQSPIQRLRQQ